MTFWQWLQENWVKTLSSIGALNSALITATASGMFNGLLPDNSIKWLALGGFFMNAWLIGVGFNNSTKEKVATAMETAIKATPGQGGFARPLLLVVLLAIAVPALFVLPGCATKSPQTQLILETTTRMAVRRALADSDRAIEKAANIRAVAERLHGVVTAESTILGLRDEVLREIDQLQLSPLDRADAVDLVNLFAAILEENYGGELVGDERMVKVRAFLDIVLSTLPV